jgi:hypothetical protein
MCKPKHLDGLGIGVIELFNLAILARQGWRLLHNPESLSASILKAKYYPNSNLLHSSLGSAPSQVWREIQHGLPMLKQCLIKWIGIGDLTDLMNEQRYQEMVCYDL